MSRRARFFGDVDVICDIGGQDIKVLFMKNGDVKNFQLDTQCSAGNGYFLQAMAEQVGLGSSEYADIAFGAELAPKFGYGCAVFLQSDIVNFQKEGWQPEEILAGLAAVLPKNIWQYVVQIPSLAELGTSFVLQGGTQNNLAAVKAQVDYIEERVAGSAEVFVHLHQHCGEAGAIGAAIEALRLWANGARRVHRPRRGVRDTRVTRPNEKTRAATSARTSARARSSTPWTPDGTTERALHLRASRARRAPSSSKATRSPSGRRPSARRSHEAVPEPGRLRGEARVQASTIAARPCPRTAPPSKTSPTSAGARPIRRRRRTQRGFRRAARARAAAHRHPARAQHLLDGAVLRPTSRRSASTPQNLVFSDYTTEEMYKAGRKCGSIDPCFPSKVGRPTSTTCCSTSHERSRSTTSSSR